MSSVARVFVFLNLVIAGGFLLAAATFLSANADYKGQLDAAEKAAAAEKTKLDNQIADLTSKLETRDGELSAERLQTTQLTAEKGEKETTIRDLQGKLTERDNQLRAASTNVKTLTDTVEAMRNDKNDLVSKNETLDQQARQARTEMQAAVEAKDTAQQEIVALNNTIEGHERTIASQAETINDQGLKLDYVAKIGVSLDNLTVPPPLTGSVINSDNGLKLVQINLGKKAGVTIGIEMDIVRGTQYVGRFRVDTVAENQAAGTLIIPSQGGNVMVGDRVTTTLN